MINPSELDQRVTLFSPTAPVDDGYTTIPAGWTDEGTVFAKHMAGTVREVFENSGREAELPAVFLVRRSALTERVDATWKLVHRFTGYDIKGAVRAGRDGIRITATGGDLPES